MAHARGDLYRTDKPPRNRQYAEEDEEAEEEAEEE